MPIPALFTLLDLAGVFAFAVSGAVAARDRGLDGFGIVALAFTVACGGGVLRDLCLGAVPPVGLSDWRYLALAVFAALITMSAHRLVERMAQPVLLFDSIGIGLFAVAGAQKAMIYGQNAEVAILLGTMTAIGGGVLRDVLLNRVPVILRREIYASAALLAAVIETVGARLQWAEGWRSWFAVLACFALRYLALRYHWHLPRFDRRWQRADRSADRER
ncbi:MAG: trimeric intracellular cation channel family protein [Burkholderiaceae bacterium]